MAPGSTCVCKKCGVALPHSPEVCISTLRDKLAAVQLENDSLRERDAWIHNKPVEYARDEDAAEVEQDDLVHVNVGEVQIRRTSRTVLFYGERVTLAEAARQLGLSFDALKGRIASRVGSADFGEIEISNLDLVTRRNRWNSTRERGER